MFLNFQVKGGDLQGTLAVVCGDTIASIKLQLETVTGVEPRHQALAIADVQTCAWRPLVDARTLVHEGIQDMDTIQMTTPSEVHIATNAYDLSEEALDGARAPSHQPVHMTIRVTLQPFGGDLEAQGVSVDPLMPLGELRNLARELIHPGRAGSGDLSIALAELGNLSIALAVQDECCVDMDHNLSQCNIVDGTTVTIVQVQVPPTIKEAEIKLSCALESLGAAEQALGGDHPSGRCSTDLQISKWSHQMVRDHPDFLAGYLLAHSAAHAQTCIRQAYELISCGALPSERTAAAERSIKKADRDTRDIVVLLCQATCRNPKSRVEFLGHANAAYDGNLDKEVRAQLLLAYHRDHRDPTTQQDEFSSLGQLATDRRSQLRHAHETIT